MSSREFIMGARLTLTDMFTDPLRNVRRATEAFRGSVEGADGSVRHWRDENGRLRDELGRFASETDRARNGINGMRSEANLLSSTMGGLKSMLVAVAGAMVFKEANDWLVMSNANMETYENTLTVVLKSHDKALQTLQWANQFAAQTPFEIPEIIEATTRLSAYGMEAQKVLGVTGDMASVMGKPLMQAVEAVADAQTGELERLKEFGITKQMLIDQAKKMGLNPINNQGSITDQNGLNAALFTLMEERFKGGMDMQSKTFKGMLSNAADFVGTMGRQLGKPIFDKMKNGLAGTMDWLNRLKENGTFDRMIEKVQEIGGKVWDFGSMVLGYVLAQYRTLKAEWTAFYSLHKPQIDEIGTAFMGAFNSLDSAARPILVWLRDEGVPKAHQILLELGDTVLDIAQWFTENWSGIEPLVYAIAGAFATYKAVVIGLEIATKAITVAVWLWEAAQWALNIAMDANPIGLVILAIGALIGMGVLLYKNWDVVKARAGEMWDSIKNFFIDGVNGTVASINLLIDALNKIPGISIDHLSGMQRVKTSADAQRMELTDNQSRRYLGVESGVDGSHASGLDRVPFDGYRAELHKDEAVLTANEAREWRKAGNVNPAGRPSSTGAGQGGQRPAVSGPLVGQLIIQGTEAPSVDAMVNEFLSKLYDKMRDADEILSTGGMGAAL